MDKLLSIDIGSTYTKGAILNLDGDRLVVKSKCTVPTTAEYLPLDLKKLLNKLL